MSAPNSAMRNLDSLLLCLGLALVAAGSNAANLTSYSQFGSGGGLVLGYPVPQPIESQTPVAGFRSYASLHARHQALALQNADMEAIQVGQTFNGRPIWAYRLSDPDGLTIDGENEPAFLINGGIHAREWQSPEVTTAIIEQLIAGADGHGIERYLLDEGRVIVVPVLNIDGFLQTQRYPTEVLIGEDPTDSSWPRDGRMRRKNMRVVDEILSTQGDHLFGIDLNRNHSPFWGGGSANARNLTYRGSSPNSEPETAALLAAAELGPGSALRSYADVHSYSRLLFVQNTGNSARDIAANALAGLFIYAESAYSPPGLPEYTHSPEPINRGIGTTADHFAYNHQIPAWTLELEPGENGALDYGGIGANHDGFILPESQIERVRNSVYQAQRLLFYRMLGNAYVREVRVLDARSGELMYEAGWVKQGSGRTLEIRRTLPLQAGRDYRLWLGFNKPMRLRNNGVVSQIPNRGELSIELDPSVSLVTDAGTTRLPPAAGRWLQQPGPPGFGYQRWEDDAYSIDFSVPASAGSNLRLAIDAQDITGDHLDADPGSVVNWSAGWVGFQSSFPSGDQQHLLQVSNVGASMLRLSDRPNMLSEGGALRLRLSRSNAGSRVSVRVRSENIDTSSADFAPIDINNWVLEPGTTQVDLVLRPFEDFLVEPDRRLRLHIEAADATTEIADRLLDLVLVDNDSDSAARWVLAGPDSGSTAAAEELDIALNLGSNLGRPATVELPAGLQLEAPSGRGATAYAPIGGVVQIDGHGAALTATDSARFFDVVASGSLTLRDLRLTGRADATASADGGLIRNAGALSLTQADLLNGRAGRGGQVYNAGSAQLRQLRMVGGTATVSGAQIHSSGTLQIDQSQLLQAASGDAAVSSAGQTALRSVSLVDAGTEVAIARSGGSLSVSNSLLVNAGNCNAGAGLVSLGGNLDSDASCALGNLVGSTDAVSLTTRGSLPLAVPGSAAIDAGAEVCGAQDLRGHARPQGQNARCDIGAIEIGIQPLLGLWYDPARDGSGFAIELVGDLLFVVWYTYDADGVPIAYTAQAPLRASTWSAPLLRFRRAADGSISHEQVGSVQLEFTAEDRAQVQFEFTGIGAGSLALQHLVFAEGATGLNVRGTWAAEDFPFQGLSLIDQGSTLAVVSYFYDQAGALRWALGTAPARPAASITMLRFSGSCPTCAYVAPSPRLAGMIELIFDGRDQARIHAMLEANDGGLWSASDSELRAFR
jgi:hypothetical protein